MSRATDLELPADIGAMLRHFLGSDRCLVRTANHTNQWADRAIGMIEYVICRNRNIARSWHMLGEAAGPSHPRVAAAA